MHPTGFTFWWRRHVQTDLHLWLGPHAADRELYRHGIVADPANHNVLCWPCCLGECPQRQLLRLSNIQVQPLQPGQQRRAGQQQRWSWDMCPQSQPPCDPKLWSGCHSRCPTTKRTATALVVLEAPAKSVPGLFRLQKQRLQCTGALRCMCSAAGLGCQSQPGLTCSQIQPLQCSDTPTLPQLCVAARLLI